MDIGTALSVAQTIFAALQCSELKKVCSMLGYEADLEKLQQTVETIKAVLLDAEAKTEKLTYEAKLYIKKLKDAAYDADDLIDEFVTLAQQKKLIKGNKVRLFSLFKGMGVAYNMSHGVKKVEENLANIVDVHTKFGLGINPQPIRKRRVETCSYIYANDIIGRDDDMVKIRGILIDSNVQSDVSFLTVTGMGGLGKIAVAQLVYNDKMVKDEFPLRLWVCVSDQDLGYLDEGVVLKKLLVSATHEQHVGCSLEVLQSKTRALLMKEKFLLVLDDVWTEKRDEWLKLEGFLKGTTKGSWVLVTTRSTKTAKIVGKGHRHKLEGLSNDNSWRLFEKTAFSDAIEDINASNYLTEIGQKIIERCANVPLAIRAVGTLLYGQDKTKWERVLNTGLANIMCEENGIMPILKLSYDNLDSPIKSCFSYCAVFPKDFEIRKEKLINLWIAQGYVVPLEKSQSIHDAAEEYFLVLLRRCFFQDVEKNREGEIVSCKIHDLMHDIALEVSGDEVCAMNSNIVGNLDERVRHVSVTGSGCLRSSSGKPRIRTYLQLEGIGDIGADGLLVRQLLATCICLRTLDLSRLQFSSLPKSIGKLLHLRHLELWDNEELQVIPKSITKLHNLIYLGIEDCDKLNCLPLGMGKLTHLQTLDRFMLGKTNLGKTQLFDELENLKSLVGLRGQIVIEIQIPSNGTFVKNLSSGRGAYLGGKQQLSAIAISIQHADNCLRLDFEEELLESLSPHSNLKKLVLQGYNCVRMPSWAIGDKLCTFLPNLVYFRICDCRGLKSLPQLGKLPYLKVLYVQNLPKLEYMEDTRNLASSSSGSSSGVGELSFFPCLEILELEHLPNLKTWWSGSSSSPFLSQLRNCKILDCSELTSIPVCPVVERFVIRDNVRSLKLKLTDASSSSSAQQRKLTTKKLGSLKLVPLECQFPTSLLIKVDEEVESLAQVRELFQNGFLSTLTTLTVFICPKIKSLCAGIEHLSALTDLCIYGCPNLLPGNAEEVEGVPWRDLGHTLHSLELGLDAMKNLPEGMQYLTSLQTLELSGCRQLKSLPNWMPKLSSLESLTINDCTEQLKERCHQTNGEDLHLIRHIPKVTLCDSFSSLYSPQCLKWVKSAQRYYFLARTSPLRYSRIDGV